MVLRFRNQSAQNGGIANANPYGSRKNEKTASTFGLSGKLLWGLVGGLAVFVMLSLVARKESLDYGDDKYSTNNLRGGDGDGVVVTEIITVPVLYGDDHHDNPEIAAVETQTVRQLHINDLSRHQVEKPLLLTGWQESNRANDFSKIMKYENFVDRFGNYTQYVKSGVSVQPTKDKDNNFCIAPASSMKKIMETSRNNILLFTNDLESPAFMRDLRGMYTIPDPINYELQETGNDGRNSFHVFSGMVKGSNHVFHKHDEAQIYQVHGRKMWWFLPPSFGKPPKANPCDLLTGKFKLSKKESQLLSSVLQQPGDTVLVPDGWYHATCALDDWTVGVGMQRSSPHKLEQKFDPVPQLNAIANENLHPMPWKDEVSFQQRLMSCGVEFNWNNLDSWVWFNGDIGKYYNELIGSDSKRNPNEISSYAVHRWMGKERSTLIHYELILSAMRQFTSGEGLRVLDAGCGLGAGLMWFETNGPKSFDLVGHTISSSQLNFINNLPQHKFEAVLKSYDDLEAYGDDSSGIRALDVIYSIEAFIHSPDEEHTLKQWAKALADQGLVILVDDFLAVGVDKDAEDIQIFAKSWMANVLHTTSSLTEVAERHNLKLVLDRDLGSEYNINKWNYGNKFPDMAPTKRKSHQGWLGSKMRQRLMIEGKLTYRLVVFQKQGGVESPNISKNRQSTQENNAGLVEEGECSEVQTIAENMKPLVFEEIVPEHRTGKGSGGGSKMKCISGWYCCGMGEAWWENLDANRTDTTSYLKLDKSLFGDYMEKVVEHLNKFYRTLPEGTVGKFLDIGGTGNVAKGMRKVTSKFSHFAGPFDYWLLDSDSAAKGVENALHCDMADCKEAPTCGFDVTFSHTVLEHTHRPWDTFDTIARITKKGGLTAHVVPFSYQYHATPDDNFRFSHRGVTTLLEDRGFTILDVGYDICTKPDKVLRERIDEHFDTIWLVYVIAQKN